MSRSVLVVGGLVVVAAVIALVVVLGSDDDDKDDASSSPAAETTGPTATSSGGAASGTTDRPVLPTPRTATDSAGSSSVAGATPGGPPPLDTRGEVTVTERPRGSEGPQAGSGATGSAAEYSVSDVHIRDHRGGSGAPLDVPPSIHTPDGPRIASSLTNAIGQQVKAVLLDCARGTSGEGRGAKPRVDGQLVILVKSQQLGVQQALMQPHDVSPATAATIKQCSEPKILQLTAAAPGQADLANYGINITVMLPAPPPS